MAEPDFDGEAGPAVGRGDQRTVRPTVFGARRLESVMSVPARVSMTRASVTSAAVRFTVATSPATVTDPLAPVTTMASSPFVPSMVMVSISPSPVPLAGVPSRLLSSVVRSVPAMSRTRTESTPARVARSICSTSSRSIVMLPMLRKKRTRCPLAETSKASSTPAPLNVIASSPS